MPLKRRLHTFCLHGTYFCHSSNPDICLGLLGGDSTQPIDPPSLPSPVFEACAVLASPCVQLRSITDHMPRTTLHQPKLQVRVLDFACRKQCSAHGIILVQPVTVHMTRRSFTKQLGRRHHVVHLQSYSYSRNYSSHRE